MRGEGTLLGSLIFATSVACLWNSVPHQPVTRPLQKGEIVGVWHATKDSLGDYAAEGLTRYASDEAHRLEFRADGSCAAKTLLGDAQGQPIEPDMPCKWDVVAQADGPEVRIEVTIRTNQTTGHGYTVAEENGHLMLWSYITDPDARRYAEFTKGD